MVNISTASRGWTRIFLVRWHSPTSDPPLLMEQITSHLRLHQMTPAVIYHWYAADWPAEEEVSSGHLKRVPPLNTLPPPFCSGLRS
jgi:hypothetical protein